MKVPENMTRDALIRAVRKYRKALGLPTAPAPKPRKCLDPELHEFRPCDCPPSDPALKNRRTSAPRRDRFGRTAAAVRFQQDMDSAGED